MKITYSIDGYDISYAIIAKCTGIIKDVKNQKISSFRVDIINVIEDNDTVLDSIQKTNEGKIVYAFDPYQPIPGYKIEFLKKENDPEYFV